MKRIKILFIFFILAINIFPQSSPDPFVLIKENKLEELKAFCESTDNIDISDKDDLTPLIHAIVNKNIEAVQILIDNGADVNYKIKKGLVNKNRTPVYFAVQKDNMEILKLLFDSGAMINNRVHNMTGGGFIYFVILKRNVEAVRLMFQYSDQVIPPELLDIIKEGKKLLNMTPKMVWTREYYEIEKILNEQEIIVRLMIDSNISKEETEERISALSDEDKAFFNEGNYDIEKLESGIGYGIIGFGWGHYKQGRTSMGTFFSIVDGSTIMIPSFIAIGDTVNAVAGEDTSNYEGIAVFVLSSIIISRIWQVADLSAYASKQRKKYEKLNQEISGESAGLEK